MEWTNHKNSLERGLTLPGNRIACEWWIANAEKPKGITVSFNEFLSVISTHSYFPKDTDLIMNFLGALGESLETDSLTVRVYDDEYLKGSLKGTKFPNTTLDIQLPFLNPNAVNSRIAGDVMIQSDSLHIKLEDYEGKTEYEAWESAISTLKKRASDKSPECDLLVSSKEEKVNFRIIGSNSGIYIQRDSRLSRAFDSFAKLSLGQIHERYIGLTELVQTAHNATDKMKKMYAGRVQDLSRELLEESKPS